MNEIGRAIFLEMVQQELQRLKTEPPPLPAPPEPAPRTSIHYTELREDPSNDPAAPGYNVFVREVGRLIAEGNEGKWIVIAEGRLIGVYDTRAEAHCVIAIGHFTWPCTLRQVLVQIPLLPAPIRCNRCRN